MDPERISRRRLLGGAAIGATLPVLHELVPHRGLHHAIDGASAATDGHPVHGDPALQGAAGAHSHSGFAAGAEVDHRANGFDPSDLVRDFDWGKTTRLPGRPGAARVGACLGRQGDRGRSRRQVRLPGPTTAASRVRPCARARASGCGSASRNGSSHPHTIHFHGVHPDFMDGMPGIGEGIGGGLIRPGESFTYEFDAEPFGMHLYHCHATPLASHIAKGLYGAFVIDPKEGREDADELVMVMNAFDTNFDFANEVYAVNTIGFHYARHPIRVKRDELVRIYLMNIVEYDPLNSFHVHANFFHYFPTGTSLTPIEFTDTVVQGQGQRGILELRFPYTGRYMFHAHKTEFAELGWLGFFEVID